MRVDVFEILVHEFFKLFFFVRLVFLGCFQAAELLSDGMQSECQLFVELFLVIAQPLELLVLRKAGEIWVIGHCVLEEIFSEALLDEVVHINLVGS